MVGVRFVIVKLFSFSCLSVLKILPYVEIPVSARPENRRVDQLLLLLCGDVEKYYRLVICLTGNVDFAKWLFQPVIE